MPTCRCWVTPRFAEVGLWNSVGFRGSLWARPNYRVRLKDRRHVQVVDIMARRGGRCFATAVTGQLLSEGVQPPAERVISEFCSLIAPKEEKILLQWTLHCPQ